MPIEKLLRCSKIWMCRSPRPLTFDGKTITWQPGNSALVSKIFFEAETEAADAKRKPLVQS